MTDNTQKNITLEEALQLAQTYCKEGKLQESADLCSLVLRQYPDNILALCLSAIIYKSSSDPDRALPFLDKVISLDANFSDAHHEKAVVLAMIGQIAEAADICEQAIALNPNDFTYHNTHGHCLFKMGLAQEAIMAFNTALQLSPDNGTLFCNIAAIHSYVSSTQQWSDYVDEALSNDIFRQEAWRAHKADLLTSKALVAWITGSRDECHKLIEEAAERLEGQEHYPDYRYVDIYIKWLQALLQEEIAIADDGLPALHFVGDSHSIALAQGQANWQDTDYKARAHLIKGCKAWHVGNEEPNHYKLAFERVMEEIPSDEPVVFVFGEIDCRADEGVFVQHKKHNTDINENISQLVSAYIAAVKAHTQGRAVAPIIWGVPAPLKVQVSTLPADDQPLFVDMIAQFNKALEAAAAKNAMVFMDVYALTAATDGLADGSQHLGDAVHLRPSLYLNALKNTL